MIIVCGHCGAELDADDCDCRRSERPLSHLEAVVATAAAMGRIDEPNLQRAAYVLRGKAD